MVTALVMINAERSKVNDVAEALAAVDGISEVYSVAGQYDLVAIIRVKENDELSDLVTKRMLTVDGIIASETLVAFRAHSKHDLDTMFSIGMDA